MKVTKLPVIVLCTTMLVIPALELMTRDFNNPIWKFLTFLVLGLGVLTIMVIPWLRSGWVRERIRQEVGSNPNAVAFPAIVSSDSSAPGNLVVLVADSSGLRLFAKSGLTQSIAWARISRLSSSLIEKTAEGLIEVFDDHHEPTLGFVPIHSNGSRRLTVWRVDEIRSRLEVVRSRAKKSETA